MVITRFAPSPNGKLHLGHAYAAIRAFDLARHNHGTALLRIEDIDGQRSRAELVPEFRADLEWLGLEFTEVPAQLTRVSRYENAIARLKDMGVLYPCTCTRAQIAAAAQAFGQEGPIYPGTCRHKAHHSSDPHVLRLNVAAATAITGPLRWIDDYAGEQDAAPDLLGDVVIQRKDDPASYHLAATLDDDADGVTHVTRGRDLFSASHIHRVLQALLDLRVPRWHHHQLVCDASGQKLAKRRGSAALGDLRAAGVDGIKLANDLRKGLFSSGISLI